MSWSFGDQLVRTVTGADGEPWFVGKDVAQALGYQNTNKALGDHVDEDDKMQGDGVTIRDPIGREQHPVIINESGVYSLVFGSKLETAKAFKKWVTSEVLPAIRKHGGYITEDKAKEIESAGVYAGMAKLLKEISTLHRQGIIDTSDARASVMSVFEDAKIPVLSTKEAIMETDALYGRKNDIQKFIVEMLEKAEESTNWKDLYSAFCQWSHYTLDEFGLPSEKDALTPRMFTAQMKKYFGITGNNGDCIYLDGKSSRGLKNLRIKQPYSLEQKKSLPSTTSEA